jgi:hypothetical protein
MQLHLHTFKYYDMFHYLRELNHEGVSFLFSLSPSKIPYICVLLRLTCAVYVSNYMLEIPHMIKIIADFKNCNT